MEFNAKSFFSYFLGAAAIGLVGYVFFGVSKSVNKPSASVERGTRTEASAAAAASDWAGEVYKPKAQSQAIGRKKVSKKSAAPSSPKAAST